MGGKPYFPEKKRQAKLQYTNNIDCTNIKHSGSLKIPDTIKYNCKNEYFVQLNVKKGLVAFI